MKIPNPLIYQFRTPEDFTAYLKSIAAPEWFKKVAVHHTLVPTVKQWRGLITMKGMLNFYKRQGWTKFPHIFVAPDGIWQMNNLLLRGVHTNAANPFTIGVEVVGNYDKTLWQEPIYDYAFETIAALQNWGKLNTTDIVLHRTYNPTKTCPGSAITYDWLVNTLTEMKERDENKEVTYRVKFDSTRIRQGPSIDYPVAGQLNRGDMFISSVLKKDEGGDYINGIDTWAHVTKAINTQSKVDHLGFIHRSLLEIVE